MSGDGRIARVTAIQKLRVGSVTFRDLRAYAVDRDDEHADGLFPFTRSGACRSRPAAAAWSCADDAWRLAIPRPA